MLNKKRKISTENHIQNDKQVNEDDSIISSKFKTLSIAIPSSIIDNAQSKELRAYLVGQIARTCAIFKVDEIVIYHDSEHKGTVKDKLRFCLTNLQYLETPQYLRKTLFPFCDDLVLAGLMNPLDISHHLRTTEYCKYREGIVLKRPVKDNKGCWVDIGLRKYCYLDVSLPEKTRVTIRLDKECQQLHEKTELNINNDNNMKNYTGKIVSSLVPKSKGLYWGYLVRVADSFEDVFTGSIFNGKKYDLIIGTSDKGEDCEKLELKKNYNHAIIILGGIQGIEGVVESDEKSKIKGNEIQKLFDVYVNTCPNQGSRTIRTEEALMITLAALQYKLRK